MWICVEPRDPDTKPSRGRLWVGLRKPRLVLAEFRATRNKVTATPRSGVLGCWRRRSRLRPPCSRLGNIYRRGHCARHAHIPELHLFYWLLFSDGNPKSPRNPRRACFLAFVVVVAPAELASRGGPLLNRRRIALHSPLSRLKDRGAILRHGGVLLSMVCHITPRWYHNRTDIMAYYMTRSQAARRC